MPNSQRKKPSKSLNRRLKLIRHLKSAKKVRNHLRVRGRKARSWPSYRRRASKGKMEKATESRKIRNLTDLLTYQTKKYQTSLT